MRPSHHPPVHRTTRLLPVVGLLLASACIRTDWVATYGGLVADTTTPTSITWSWNANSLGTEVSGYFLWYAPGQPEAQLSETNASLWNGTDDPNLEWDISPFGPGQVHRTTVSDLDPNTQYTADLWAIYADGREERVATGSDQTLPLLQESISLFSETLPTGSYLQGYEDPSLAAEVRTGTAALWYPTTAGGTANLIAGDLDVDVSSITTEQWETAILRFHISITSSSGDTHPVHFLHVSVANMTDDFFAYDFPRYATLPDRLGWHTVEIRLAHMVDDTRRAVTRTAFGDRFGDVLVGTNWMPGHTVYVDDVEIIY